MISTIIMAAALNVSVGRAFCNAPCQQTVTIRAEHNAANREMKVSVFDSEGNYEQNSSVDMNEFAPRSLQITYKNLPGGDFNVVVTLMRNDGTHVVAATTFHVVGFVRKP